MDDMGIFRTTIGVAPLSNPGAPRTVHDVMVDTGSEYNWIPRPVLESLGIEVRGSQRFETADGRVLERDVGWAILHAAGFVAPTIVVFAAEGDMTLLGALGLESLNLRVDLPRRQLIPAGPVPAAATGKTETPRTGNRERSPCSLFPPSWSMQHARHRPVIPD